MTSLAYRPTVTVVDVLDAGACIDGVKRFLLDAGGRIAGATDQLMKAFDEEGRGWVAKASNADGDGYGDGYGYGDGDGYGDGYGYGYGDGENE